MVFSDLHLRYINLFQWKFKHLWRSFANVASMPNNMPPYHHFLKQFSNCWIFCVADGKPSLPSSSMFYQSQYLCGCRTTWWPLKDLVLITCFLWILWICYMCSYAFASQILVEQGSTEPDLHNLWLCVWFSEWVLHCKKSISTLVLLYLETHFSSCHKVVEPWWLTDSCKGHSQYAKTSPLCMGHSWHCFLWKPSQFAIYYFYSTTISCV